MKLKFVNGPGEIYDLLSVFTDYFSKERQPAEEGTEKMRRYVGTIEEHIALFFKEKENGDSFALNEHFPGLLQEHGVSLALERLCEAFSKPGLWQRVMQFYLGRPVSNKLSLMGAEIMGDKVLRQVRYEMLSFRMNARPILKLLFAELERVDQILRPFRELQQVRLQKCQQEIESLGVQKFVNLIGEIPGYMVRWNKCDNLYISMSAVKPKLLVRQTVPPLIILGCDYQMALQEMGQDPNPYDLIQILGATGDPLRGKAIKILQKREHGVTLQELAKMFGVSNNVVQYQMKQLVDCGLVKAEYRKIRGKRQVNYRYNFTCSEYAALASPRLFGFGKPLTIEEKRGPEALKWWNQ